MAEVLPSRPAWQTDDLEDEWIEPDSQDDGTQSISMTESLAVQITLDQGSNTPPASETESEDPGTFLIRHNLPPSPFVPRTPGRNKGVIKDFFSPLPLERMFDPPSPPLPTLPRYTVSPAVPSRLSQVHLPESLGNETDDDKQGRGGSQRKASVDCQFTFAVPRAAPPSANGPGPQAQSTPGPPSVTSGAVSAPITDPRLRLFQFQYDTFTREHLSAIVDSIAVNTSAGTNTPSTPNFTQALSRIPEALDSSMSHLRSTKRVKLSPPSDYYGEGDGAGATIARPKVLRKDYVGESRSLMQQIKQARDFSTISTMASAQTPTSRGHEPNAANQSDLKQTPDERNQHLVPPEVNKGPSSGGTSPSSRGSYSSLAYRLQAADLMAQIKHDMNRSRRQLSVDTEVSFVTQPDQKSRAGSSSPERTTSRRQEDKENIPNGSKHSHSSNLAALTTGSRPKPSPRKLLRRLSAADEVDRELAQEASNITVEEPPEQLPVPAPTTAPVTRVAMSSIHPPNTDTNRGLHPPPSYPSSSIRSSTGDDLNRFVSSSTVTGTTLTAGSAPSYVKHAGPAHMRCIGPEDVPALPERVGKMVFDRVMMKWVKDTALATMGMVEHDRREHTNGTDGESDDPFRDIESLPGDGEVGIEGDQPQKENDRDAPMTVIEERSEVDDREEAELTSFSFDEPPTGIVHVMTGVDDTAELEGFDDDQTTDSADEGESAFAQPTRDGRPMEMSESSSDDDVHLDPNRTIPPRPADAVALSTPVPPHRNSSTPIRSVLKSASATPISALKDPNRNKHRTPTQRRSHRRSVSFSDGKREGPIRGLSRSAIDGNGDVDKVESTGSGGKFVPSARSKRIADMMENLEDSEPDESPSKISSGRPTMEELQPLVRRRALSANAAGGGSQDARRVFSRSQTQRVPRTGNNTANANATFLTECSFGVAHDRLVQVITDVQPFEPHWEELSSIDLSKKNVESVARLKEFLPRLNSLCLNSNQLSWLSGIPDSVRTLSVASNLLTGITSFNHIRNIENLDISGNDIDSLDQLRCLRCLRELRADGNKICNIDGLQKMDCLVKLSLEGNCIRSVDLTHCRWPRVEMLNLSHNRIETVAGLASLASLIAFNIDGNSLTELEPKASILRLRILRVSGNRLHQLNTAHFPNLRTLYADNNSLTTLTKADHLIKLENLSVRNQSGRGFNLLTRDVRDTKRLYLSGNALKTGFLEVPSYQLVYLELAACRLAKLPGNFVTLAPNLRVLNLNYNFLEDAGPLEGLTRLRKVTMIGSRLKGTKPLIRLLQRLPDLEMLDFRMNPCTLGWYLPLVVKEVPGAMQAPSEGTGASRGWRGENGLDHSWQDLDVKFRRDLPDEGYIGRLAYRGLVMRACPKIRMLDGVEVTEKERAKAQRLLAGMMNKRRARVV